MKKIFLYVVIILSLCASTCDGNLVRNTLESEVVNIKEEIYADFSVENTELRIVNRGGRCVLLYKPERAGREIVGEAVDLGMPAPCNFIRSGNEYKPKYFTYGEGTDRRAVFLITGGPPSVEFPANDQFMPNGCGTWLAKIYVYEHRVKVAWTGDNGPPSCPSSGADEVEFAS